MRQILAVALAVLLLAAVLFAVSPTSAEEDVASLDPRVGTVLSVQGRGLVRPGDRRRWTPLARDAVLLPGDSLKTGARGAHALEVQLVGDTSLLLGPDALVVLPEKGAVRVLGGEVEVRGTPESTIALFGPGGFARKVIGTAWLHVEGTAATLLEKEPTWLTGYRASTGNEWMGSLLANVDGRNVPLAVGYHKVTADIRDQIARTTIEQSFVNSTDSRLEGVFYFPLPADASISGFAMWIGNELVEADVVEKARARQIYEDILRRKKDPGLLEWQGGNLFKARVFPIEPHSEKRIRLRYTQVLRLEGQTWRYRYALRSDLLRSKPLRRLDIQVNVSSTRPLTEVACPSHACQIDTSEAGTEARVRFDAEEYVPTRDLEVVVTLEPSAGLSAVTHRRGAEGTFMLLLSPPAGEGAGWTRELVPDGDPLDLLVVADTSGSMDAAARETQADFVGGLLDLLGPDDRFRLVAADVGVHAAFDAAQAVTAETREAARAFLDGRVSLGWTDLDGTLDAVLGKAGAGTLVIYLGDGIPTTGDADPVAQAERVRQRGKTTQATVHAVATSATYEQGVLDALASIGGGSVRRADAAPAAAAYALIQEVARPMLRNAKIEIRGIPTARVYPASLPNLPVGGQQVVLGRFLPGGAASEGQVVVTGDLDGEPVTFTSTLRLPAAEAGNSFLPRLWARKHLDALLAQGAAQAVKDEIVAFSAEYGILTPHTSLLVLESDEDRERYGVARTVSIRDGEAFFAEGRDRVALEMAREQSRKARAWRQGLRRRMLGEIQGLGRGLLPDRTVALLVVLGETRVTNARFGAAESWGAKGKKAEGRKGGYAAGSERLGVNVEGLRDRRLSAPGAPEPVIRDAEIADHVETDNDLPFEESLGEDGLTDAPFDGPVGAPSTPAPPRARRALSDADDFEAERGRFGGRGGRRARSKSAGRPSGGGRFVAGERLERAYAARVENLYDQPLPGGLTPAALGFPWMSDPLEPARELPAPDWSEEVVALLASLDRKEALAALSGGLRLARQTARVHPVRPEDVLGSSSELVLVSPRRWFVRSESSGTADDVSWVDAEHRAHVDATRLLGRRRAAMPRDLEDAALLLATFSYEEFVETYRRHRVRIDGRKSRIKRVRIESDDLDGVDRVLLVDPERRLIVGEVTERRGRVLSRVRHGGFVEVGGLWWSRLTRVFDERKRMTSFVSSEVTALEAEAFDGAFEAATAFSKQVLFLDGKLPPLADAKQAAHESSATFADHLVLALHEAGRQRWDETLAAWHAARSLVEDHHGTAWIELAILLRARRGEALLTHARSLAELGGDAAELLYAQVAGGLGANERLALLARLESGWRSHDDRAGLRFDRARSAALDQAGRRADARALRARISAARPLDLQAARDHVSDLLAVGDVEAAVGLLEERLTVGEAPRFTFEERASLYQRLTDILWSERRLADLEITLAAWTETAETQEAWRRRLSLRFLRGEVAESDAWVLQALEARVPADPLSGAYAQLQAAIRLALGEAWMFNARRVEPAFVPALVDLGRRIARRSIPRAELLRLFSTNWRFRRTDGQRLLESGLREDALATDAETPVRRLVLYGGTVPWARNVVDASVFTAFTAGLDTRWAGMPVGRERDALADLLVRLYDAHSDRDQAIDVLRKRLESERGHRRTRTASRLFDRLVARPDAHDAAVENEAFALLPELLDPYAPEVHEDVAATAARRLARWSFDTRLKALRGDPATRKDLTRAEAREQDRQDKAGARRGLVERLGAARATAAPPFLRWLELERLGYAVELGDSLPAVLAATIELLDGVPKTSDDALDIVLAERCVLTLDYLVVRRNAPAGAADLLLDLLADRDADAADQRLDWKFETFRLLLALDQAARLETALSGWIQPAQVRSLWRVGLGYVLAEQGRLDEAARLFEQVAASDELSARSYGVLAGWYLALGDDVARERALEGQDGARSENELSNLVWQARSRMRSPGPGGVPADFDPETLRHIRWLLKKSSRPENHVWRLQALYENVRDHRLLESLALGLPGHTPEGVYGFLRRAGPLTAKVFEEATVDAAIELIQALTETAEKPHDRRALLLLQVMLDTRAAQATKADPSHERRAVSALAAIALGDWAPGERAQVADVIADTAPVKQPQLRATRVQLVRTLLEEEPADSPWRLGIADALARIYWAQGEKAQAIDVLTVALAAARDGDGRLPREAWAAFDRLVTWTADVGHHREAERYLETEMERAEYASRRHALHGNLLGLYVRAAAQRGTLSFGSGEALVTQATARMDAWLAEGPPSSAIQTASYVVELHKGAKGPGLSKAEVTARLERWARGQLPAHFDRLRLEAMQLARTAAHGLRRVADARVALSYALDHMDAEPAWLGRIAYDYWSNDHYQLARFREDAEPIGALRGQLLPRVLTSLTEYLQGGRRTGQSFWRPTQGRFWAEPKDEYAAVASAELELRPTDVALQKRAATYLRELGRRAQAVGALKAALARSDLDDEGAKLLATWMVADDRFAEALLVLEPLLETRVDDLDIHVLQARALHGVDRADEAVEALRRAEARWRERRRWNDSVAARLGETALQIGRAQPAETWLEEAVRLRSAAVRGGADGRLGGYFGLLARARVALGKTDAAVDAAAAGVVAWGRNARQRSRAIVALEEVFKQAQDLGEYVARYEAKVAETGLDAPVIRKALGDVFTMKRQHADAVAHFLAAREIAPEDAGIHRRLVAAYDALGQKAEAVEALLASLAQAPRNLEAAADLTTRYAAAGLEVEAERARTNLVEPLPHEAEGHRRLAAIRERSKDDAAALVQWRQVVRTEPLDPTGWLAEARCCVRLGHVEEARAALAHVLATTWEARFGDVQGEAATTVETLR